MPRLQQHCRAHRSSATVHERRRDCIHPLHVHGHPRLPEPHRRRRSSHVVAHKWRMRSPSRPGRRVRARRAVGRWLRRLGISRWPAAPTGHESQQEFGGHLHGHAGFRRWQRPLFAPQWTAALGERLRLGFEADALVCARPRRVRLATFLECIARLLGSRGEPTETCYALAMTSYVTWIVVHSRVRECCRLCTLIIFVRRRSMFMIWKYSYSMRIGRRATR